jgi:hypothetical protein
LAHGQAPIPKFPVGLRRKERGAAAGLSPFLMQFQSVPSARLVSLASVVLLPILLTALAAILSGSTKPWVILGGAMGFAVAVSAILWRVLRRASRLNTYRLLCGLLDHPVFASWIAIITGLLATGVYAVPHSPSMSPVVLLVPTNRFMARLGDPVRLEMRVEEPNGKTSSPSIIPSYEGRPLWIGARKKLEVPEPTRQNYGCFMNFPVPEAFPGTTIALRPGMRIRIKLYYINSTKLYLNPPQEPIVVEVSRPEPNPIQVGEIDGP